MPNEAKVDHSPLPSRRAVVHGIPACLLLQSVRTAFGHGFKPQDVIEYAAAASCLKHSIALDVNLSTVAEVRQLMAGDGSGRVQR